MIDIATVFPGSSRQSFASKTQKIAKTLQNSSQKVAKPSSYHPSQHIIFKKRTFPTINQHSKQNLKNLFKSIYQKKPKNICIFKFSNKWPIFSILLHKYFSIFYEQPQEKLFQHTQKRCICKASYQTSRFLVQLHVLIEQYKAWINNSV